MKKPTAAEIAAEFAAAANASRKYIQCRVCQLPPEIREAVRLCLEGNPPMNGAEVARQLSAKLGRKFSGESVREHYRQHIRKAA